MADFIINPIAKWALKKAATAAGGKVGNGILEFLYGDPAERKLDRVEAKLRQLIDGQDRVVDMIKSIPAHVTLHGVMINFNTALRGKLMIISSETKTKDEIASLNAFLQFTGSDTALALADNLFQCLFGEGCVTPQSAWKRNVDVTQSTASFGRNSHVQATISEFVQSKGNNLGLEEFVAKISSTYEEILNYYAYLGFTIYSVVKFLEGTGGLDPAIKERMNPKLGEITGLVDLLAERIYSYLMAIFPAAIELNYKLFELKTTVKAAILTKKGDRILECNNDRGRAPLKRGGAFLGEGHYKGVDKIIYAEYNKSMLSPDNANCWWEFSAPQSAGVLPHTVALRSLRGNYYLGLYKFVYYRGRHTKFGPGGTSSEEDLGVGAGATHKVNWWSIYVSRDTKDNKYYFSFFSRYKNGCLCVNEINQFSGRQSFIYGSADGNDHKCYSLQFG